MIQRVDDMNAQKVRVDNDIQKMIGLGVTDWTVADGAWK